MGEGSDSSAPYGDDGEQQRGITDLLDFFSVLWKPGKTPQPAVEMSSEGMENLECVLAEMLDASNGTAAFVPIALAHNFCLAGTSQSEGVAAVLDRTLQSLPQIVVALDYPDATIRYVNSAFLTVTGFSRDQVVGEKWFDMFIPGEHLNTVMGYHSGIGQTQQSKQRSLLQSQCICQCQSQTQCDGVAMQFDNPIRTKDGRHVAVEWTNSCIYDSALSLVGTLSIGKVNVVL